MKRKVILPLYLLYLFLWIGFIWAQEIKERPAPQLQSYYEDVNRVYFGDKLPHDIRVLYCTNGNEFEYDRRVICVSDCTCDHKCSRLTVLHETVHVAQWERNGELPLSCDEGVLNCWHQEDFHKEMLRLANAGAMRSDW